MSTCKSKNKLVNRELPGNALSSIVKQYMKDNPKVQAAEIAERVPMSQNNFWNYLDPRRNIDARAWPKFRKALRLNRKEFWNRVEKFYEEDGI